MSLLISFQWIGCFNVEMWHCGMWYRTAWVDGWIRWSYWSFPTVMILCFILFPRLRCCGGYGSVVTSASVVLNATPVLGWCDGFLGSPHVTKHLGSLVQHITSPCTPALGDPPHWSTLSRSSAVCHLHFLIRYLTLIVRHILFMGFNCSSCLNPYNDTWQEK